MSSTDHSYPLDSWKIREIHFNQAMAGRNETIFSLANGHLGMRGNFEEGACNVVNGTYINGFFEESPIVYGEVAYGYARNRQVMLNVADAKRIRLSVNGEPLDLATGNLVAYQRTLDLATGLLTREVRWVAPGGSVIELTVRRLVSLERRNVAAIDYEISSKNGEIAVELESVIDASVTNQAGSDDPRIGTHLAGRPLTTIASGAEASGAYVVQRTANTRMTVVCAVEHLFDATGGVEAAQEAFRDEKIDEAGTRWRARLARGETLHLTKFIAYFTSREAAEEELLPSARNAAAAARDSGFAALAEEQRRYLDRFWSTADIEVEGDEAVQQGLRYNLFSLLQSAGRDGVTGTAAKGLSGEGYEGHYFWDTEIYALPFFTYGEPEIARSLLDYRCGILGKAKDRARQMSQKGALFPWRTIGGEETSPYYPAGSAQYHINADIVFALAKYLNATGDEALLLEGGAELIFETARLWADLGDWLPAREDRRPELDVAPREGMLFYINEVTGPDEYTALVNNNTYTNLMAQFNLETAVAVAERLRSTEPERYLDIAERIGLAEGEIEEWRACAAGMFLPYDRKRGISAQDDAFLHRAAWDFSGTPKEHYPLLLHFHPLVIYRYQVLKQPDVVLAQVLRGDCFTLAEKKRNFDYYDPLTTGDSSLSPCIQCVAAVELGYTEKAYRYFMRTARMDLDDINGNVADGIHTAAMAGTWISLVYGFAGMRDYGGSLSFSPRLPSEWRRLRLKLRIRGRILSVDITHGSATYEIAGGGSRAQAPLPAGSPSAGGGAEPLAISHRGRELLLVAGKPALVSLRPILACVVFDLDGVITDTAEYHFQAWSRIAEEVGAPIDRSFNERLKGVSRMESLELILRNGGKELTEKEKLELAERKNGYYRELIKSITPADILPGMEELLRRLKTEGVKIAIASVSHNVWEVVKRLGIGDMLDLIVDPSTVVKGKPDPEIFMRAAETLRLPCDHCAGVEDAQAGVEAIRAAGMFTIGIGGSLEGADWVLPDTRALSYDEMVRRFGSDWASRPGLP